MSGLLPPSARRQGRPASPNGVLAIVCVAICLANLDLFIVNVALPDMAQSLGGVPLSDMSWVLNAYAITYAGSVALTRVVRFLGPVR